MMTKRTARWRLALLGWLLDGNEPLAGDLIEESRRRSRAWFWRQLMFAVLARTVIGVAALLRDPVQLLGPLASLAMFVVLCFQVVVAGSLFATVLPLIRIGRPEWWGFIVLSSFPVACVIGNTMIRLRARSRLGTVMICGGSAAVAALLTHSVLSPTAAVFFPAVGHQAAAIVFVVGLLTGAADFGWFRHAPASPQTDYRPRHSYRT